MFDISWTEFLLIGVVALIFIGPKELPAVLRTLGQWTRRIRSMAADFQNQFQEAMREAEMADLKKSFDEVREAASGFTSGNLMTSLEKDVNKALDIDVLDKPVASATEAPAVEPPVTPTTPETPIPETFTEADAHAAASQPLAIVQEAQAQPAPQDTAPAAPDVLKDAKAS